MGLQFELNSKIKFSIIATATIILAFVSILSLKIVKAQNSCPAVDTSRGTVTSTFSVSSTGSYKVWARVSTQNTNNDSFILEVDNTVCGIVMGDTSIPASGWKWINYRNGSTSNIATVNLTAGSHTLKLIGREDGVKVDRVLFIPSESSCVPDNTSLGDNCMTTIDTSPPTTAITAPTNNQTIGGNFTLQANASDDVGVTKVEFYVGNTLVATDTTSPYSFTLNTNSGNFPNGTYNFSSLAYDSVNQTRSTNVSATIFNQPVDTTLPSVSITSPLNNSTISGNSVTVSASANDASGIAKVEFLIDGIVKNTAASSPYSYKLDTTSLSKGSHTITVRATDKANLQRSESITVFVDNTVQSKKCDFDGDNNVGLSDLSILLTNYGKTMDVNTNGDCTGDRLVALDDLSTLLTGYGK